MPSPPWILKIIAKKRCVLDFEWEKTNFITFGPPLEKYWKNPLVTPWKKSFRRPCLAIDYSEIMTYF